jgi:hypothetical protein
VTPGRTERHPERRPISLRMNTLIPPLRHNR